MISLNNEKPVWVRDSDHGFLLGKIVDIGADQVTVQLHENKKVVDHRCDTVCSMFDDTLERVNAV
jgi:hypothetical protein